MSELPESQVQDAYKLEADGYVELFQIKMANSGGTMFVKANDTVTYLGDVYEAWGVQMTGTGQNSDGENVRPKFTVVNPDGVFSGLIARGAMDNAEIVRLRILRNDLVNNTPGAAREQRWNVFRVVSLNKALAIFELRSIMDGQFFQIPARVFVPPQFPFVKLS